MYSPGMNINVESRIEEEIIEKLRFYRFIEIYWYYNGNLFIYL